MRQMFERALVPRFVLGELQPSQGGDGIQGQLHPRLGLPRRVRQSALVSHRARDGRLQEQMLQRALPSFFNNLVIRRSGGRLRVRGSLLRNDCIALPVLRIGWLNRAYRSLRFSH